MVSTVKEGIDYKVSDVGQILNLNGLPIPVLHQYDRHPELAASLIRKLA